MILAPTLRVGASGTPRFLHSHAERGNETDCVTRKAFGQIRKKVFVSYRIL